MPDSRSILLAGLGNTGSHLAPLIARMGLSEHLVIVDPDIVEEDNMTAQAYRPDEVGQPKASGTADLLRQIRPALRVEAFVGELEDLPLGCFSGLVILCLDQDGARQVAAERCWQTGGVLYDVAVNGPAGLARLTRILPGAGRACLECSWSDGQYAKLPVRNSCRKTPPTDAPAALGSFAASLTTLWMNSEEAGDDNVEVVSSPTDGEMFVTRLTPNPDCRFDHRVPGIAHFGALDPLAPLPVLFDRLRTKVLAVPGFTFARRTRCVGCGSEEEVLQIARGPAGPGPCKRCASPLEFPGFHTNSQLIRSELSPAEEETSLEAIGLRDGDVVVADDDQWVQLGLRQSKPGHLHV
ncbi:ThiF family adenylyltransferase [Haloferula sp. A504]|uniref:ThiF family adenylyltransferase n=1 Tax=Haloferula sp. A504 TaxID=3373601 RepID=UPI0031C58B45|nr:ThiF family adenylyltransferase [Verrucomicrobiaceae bacterium E54]